MADSKRQLIMTAAEKLFVGGRIDQITLDEVAASAGVGKGTIYRYFADKDDLFFQTATNGFDELCELVRQAASPDVSFRQQLLDACRQIVGFFDRRHKLFQMITAQENHLAAKRGSVHERWMQHRTRLRDAVAQILQRGVGERLVRSDISAADLAVLLLHMMRAAARELPPKADRRPAFELAVEIFLSGAGAVEPLNVRKSSRTSSTVEARA